MISRRQGWWVLGGFLGALGACDGATVPGPEGDLHTGSPAELADAQRAAFGPPGTTASSGTEVCEPETIVGATWTPAQVTCPVLPDEAALAICSGTEIQAVVDGTGHPTVQAGIDAAPPGGTILVCPGTYQQVEAYRTVWTVDGKTLAAADPTPGATVITGEIHEVMAGAVLAHDSVVRGFTISYGRSFSLSGTATAECITGDKGRNPVIDLASSGTLTLRHSTFKGFGENPVRLQGSTTTVIEDSELADNEVQGAFCCGAIEVSGGSSLTVRRTAFLRNVADDDASGGAAIYAHANVTVVLEQTWFEENRAGGQGGGAVQGADHLWVSDSTFSGNSAYRYGAAVIEDGATLEVRDSTFVANSAVEGGIIDMGWEHTRFERVRIEGNTAAPPEFYFDRYAVISANLGDDTTWHDVVIHGNVGGVGAAHVQNGYTLTCVCCDFGAGADTNLPADLVVDGVPWVEAPLHFTF